MTHTRSENKGNKIILGIIFIVDPFQLAYVKVSDSLQSLQFCLDLCLLLQTILNQKLSLHKILLKDHNEAQKHQKLAINTGSFTFLRYPNLSLKISSCSWYSACDNLLENRTNFSVTFIVCMEGGQQLM